MKNLFSLDNPFIQFLARVGDMILTNALFIICSIPIVTIGASIAALNKVMQQLVIEEERGVFKTFFAAFRENFKQATISWLAVIVFFFGMACNLLLVANYLTGTLALVCKVLLILVMVLMVAMASYLFPLIARYENTLRQHTINACILSVIKLPKTLLLVVLNLLPLLLFCASVNVFLNTLVFWLTLGFAFVSYISNVLLMPIFKGIEENAPGAEEPAESGKDSAE